MDRRDKRRMCPHCRAMITDSDKVCTECGEKVGPRSIDLRAPNDLLAGLMPANRFVTSLLLLVNGAIYLTIYLSENQNFIRVAVKQAFFIFRGGEWWRLITAGYFHAQLMHLGMNAWALFNMGGFVEDLLGAKRMFTVYTVGTITGFLLSSIVNPNSPSLGASAGAFGLIGALIAYGVSSKSSHAQAIKKYFIESAVFGLAMGFIMRYMNIPIDNSAHIGGLAGGFVTAWLAGEPRLVNDWKEKVWTAAAGLSLFATVVAFALMMLRFVEISGK